MTRADGALRTIMLVEDDADIRQVAVMALEDIGGFKVVACDDGHAALRQIRQSRPDLVLLDWMMPVLDGGQVVLAMREQGLLGDTPIIFVTAKARREDISRMRELGAVDVITKPFDVLTLSDRIRQTWDRLCAGSAA